MTHKSSNKKHIQNIYQLLSNDDDTRACTKIPENACRQQPHNYLLILVATLFSKISDLLSSTKLVMPWLLSTAGIPSFFSGLLVPIRESGSMLPQLFIGAWVRKFPQRKWFFVASNILQAACLLAIMAIALTFTGSTAGWMVIVVISLYSLARSFASVSSKDVLGKTIDQQKRGQVSGYAAGLAGFFGVIIGLSIALGMELTTFNITLLLVAAAICSLLAGLFYSLINEYKGATEGGKKGYKEIRRAVSLIRSDRNFRQFIVTRALMMSSGLATPYIVIMAQKSNSDWFGLGAFIVLSGIASAASSLFWGNQADKDSRAVMTYTALATAVICLAAAAFSTLPQNSHAFLYGLAFFALSITHQGVRLGRKIYVVDLAEGNKRTTYVTVSNTLIGVLLLLIGIISALLSQITISVALLFFGVISLLAVFTSKNMKKI